MRFIRKVRYGQDIALFKHEGQVFWYSALAALLLALPWLREWLSSLPNWLWAWLPDAYGLGEFSLVFIYAIAGIGLMLLTGYTGLVSLGHAAFLAIGGYAHAYFLTHGWPWPLACLAATFIAFVVGGLVGIPALRMTGIYLAVATLAFAVIVEQILIRWVSVTGGFPGMSVPSPEFLGFSLAGSTVFYYLCLGLLALCMLLALNMLRAPFGRALCAIRDSEISAESMGIHLAVTKVLAFAVSAGFTGLAGALLAHRIGYLGPEIFNLLLSIQLLLMVVVGGLGSLHGVIFGAIFIGLLPASIALLRDRLPEEVAQMPGLEPAIFGLILVGFLIFEPHGIYGRWLKIRSYFAEFPLYRRATHKKQRSYLRTERFK